MEQTVLVEVLGVVAALALAMVAGVVALLEVEARMEALVERVQAETRGTLPSRASETTPTSKPWLTNTHPSRPP